MIQVSAPSITSLESRYVNEALDEGWVSSTGRFVDAFECEFAEYIGVLDAVSCSSGTTALHLALLSLGVGPGDEVILPSISFVATTNAVIYTGATPVMVDVDPGTWGVSAELIEPALTERTRAVIVVDLYGLPVDLAPIRGLLSTKGVAVVEDAAEGLGGLSNGRPCGSQADVAVFSFYGNKVLTTGEGGMVVTNDRATASRVRHLRGQGQDPNQRFYHTIVGFNYRLTNLQCALGLAQLQRLDDTLLRRQEIFNAYADGLRRRQVPVAIPEVTGNSRQAPWLFTALIEGFDRSRRDHLIQELAECDIETRPTFVVTYEMPPYREVQREPAQHKVANLISSSGISLPTHLHLTDRDIGDIVKTLAEKVT